MRRKGPADHLPAERIQDDGEIGELLRQVEIGNIVDSELLEAGQLQASRQIRHYAPATLEYVGIDHGPAAAVGNQSLPQKRRNAPGSLMTNSRPRVSTPSVRNRPSARDRLPGVMPIRLAR